MDSIVVAEEATVEDVVTVTEPADPDLLVEDVSIDGMCGVY
jgi:mycofactocin precursor